MLERLLQYWDISKRPLFCFQEKPLLHGQPCGGGDAFPEMDVIDPLLDEVAEAGNEGNVRLPLRDRKLRLRNKTGSVRPSLDSCSPKRSSSSDGPEKDLASKSRALGKSAPKSDSCLLLLLGGAESD